MEITKVVCALTLDTFLVYKNAKWNILTKTKTYSLEPDCAVAQLLATTPYVCGIYEQAPRWTHMEVLEGKQSKLITIESPALDKEFDEIDVNCYLMLSNVLDLHSERKLSSQWTDILEKIKTKQIKFGGHREDFIKATSSLKRCAG